MSMPEFPKIDPTVTLEKAIEAIIISIAAEETALSHVINAEGEKIQQMIEYVKCNNKKADIKKLLEVNKSAESLIERIVDMQMILKNKLRIAVDCLPSKPPSPPVPPCPPPVPPCPPPIPPCPPPRPPCPPPMPPCPPPRPPCPPPIPPCPSPKPLCYPVSEFISTTKYPWCSGTTMSINKSESCYDNNIKLYRIGCDSVIEIQSNSKYKIEYELELSNKTFCPVNIEAILACGENIIYSKHLLDKNGKYHLYFEDYFTCRTPKNCYGKCIFTIRLHSPEQLKIKKGNIWITELDKLI